MIRLLQFLFFGHIHTWEETKRDNLINQTFEGNSGKVGELSFCRCKTCGKPVVFKLVP